MRPYYGCFYFILFADFLSIYKLDQISHIHLQAVAEYATILLSFRVLPTIIDLAVPLGGTPRVGFTVGQAFSRLALTSM